MKHMLIVLLMMSLAVVSAEKMRESNFKGIMSDECGMPLDDGTYTVTFRIYDSQSDGNLLAEETKSVKCENGVCEVYLSKLYELTNKGMGEVWVSMTCKKGKEMTFRTRVFLEEK